ncbi:GDP-fucose protein O-fucosyltransferase 2 [Aricia agestis]|uniref:GDP-fucose protein O-fucosyltransferase 2 n=1 Tax=Aricia agestis TaxID=91739 RepID=UPI001C209ACF|nr:GDP-fucose protein O-fucosyltransferase 2 [Aricia agestis]
MLSSIGTEMVDESFCNLKEQTCSGSNSENKYIFYSVNPPEGFNLRRDVYMRFAIMLHDANIKGKSNWKLVLPPWHRLYHWKSSPKRTPWNTFFDIDSLKKFAPVVEMYELEDSSPNTTKLDRIYILQNFEDAFEGGTFTEKWKVNNDCSSNEEYAEYQIKSVKEVICVQFQGKISKLWEIVALHPNDKYVMFVHGEIPLHDNYGTKTYWDCRKSMMFNKQLIQVAEQYIKKTFKCTDNCSSFLGVHWRRQDFARARKNDIPSIEGTAKQINKAVIKHNFNITKVFIATDATLSEKQKLSNALAAYHLETYFYTPDKTQIHEGSVAIIEQIICAHAIYFIGTHESTFTFRIQEEREILGWESWTTFNRLCPDKGRCEKPSKWTIVQ